MKRAAIARGLVPAGAAAQRGRGWRSSSRSSRPGAASAAPPTPRLVLLMQSNGTHQAGFWPQVPAGTIATPPPVPPPAGPLALAANGLTSRILAPILDDPALVAKTMLVKGVTNSSGGSGNGHDHGFTGLYSGYKSIGTFNDPWGAGISIDQTLRRTLSFAEPYPTLNCGVLASDTPPFKAHRRSFSYLAARQQVPTEVDPYRLYARFFAVGPRLAPGQDPVEAAKHRLRRKQTVLDFARQDLTSLRPAAGQAGSRKARRPRDRAAGHGDAAAGAPSCPIRIGPCTARPRTRPSRAWPAWTCAARTTPRPWWR